MIGSGYKSLSKSIKIKLLGILVIVLACDYLAFYYYINSQITSKSDKATSQRAEIINVELDSEHITNEPIKLGPELPLPKHSKLKLDSSGSVPVISKIDTKEKIVFLTIDDGGTKQADMLELLQKNNIKASLYLANTFIADNYNFFKTFQTAGMPIQNHTLNHYTKPNDLSYDFIKNEICGMSNKIEQIYGTRPTLFRPPGGSLDTNGYIKLASKECGIKAIVLWIAKANGGSMQYQVGKSLRPGDIVLMHFRKEFKDDLEAFIKARDEAGLTTDYLENWI